MAVTWSAPVRYVECDQQGIVFNAHYLTYADEASSRWLDLHGVTWAELSERQIEPVVKASTLEWSAPARHGETVTVDAETEKVGRTSITARFTVRVGERVCCVVRTTYVCVHEERSEPWPEDVRTRLEAYVAAHPPAQA